VVEGDTGEVGLGIADPAAKLHIVPSAAAALQIDPYGAGAGNTGEVRLQELAASGGNFVALKSPDTLAADVTFTLPTSDGASGELLQSDGSGNLSWVAGGAGETNTASNVTSAGHGVFKPKPGFNLDFRGINAASAKISVALDGANNEIDIDLGSVALTDLSSVNTATATSGNFLVADGVDFESVSMSVDVTMANTGVVTIQANSVALTTDTTGNYAAGDGEAGNALRGDCATAFFCAGTIEVARGGSGQTTYTDGQLLIGNTTGNTLAKTTLTGTASEVIVTNGSGAVTLSLDQTDGTNINADLEDEG